MHFFSPTKNYFCHIFMAMDAILRIPHEMGIWDISCKCKRPSFDDERIKLLNGNWLPLEVELFNLTTEQESHIKSLNNYYLNQKEIARYAGFGVKNEIDISMTKEIWSLHGCYIVDFDNNKATLHFDRASVRY